MAEPVGANLDAVITKAQAMLQDVRVVRRDERPSRSLIDFEGRWGFYRIIVSEIHVADGSVRYAYYVLDAENRLFQGFDNYKQHLQERVPHRHSSEDTLTLTEPMHFDAFMAWLTSHLPRG